MMHKRTKACAIPQKVREEVETRDGRVCLFCGKTGRGEAHVVSRAHGGLGVPENIITVCRECHDRMDQSQARGMYLQIAKDYLKRHYPGWSEDKVTYNKWKGLEYGKENTIESN